MTTPQIGQLRINAKFHWLAFMFSFFKPKATINGHEVRLNWGDNVLPAPLGIHQVVVYIPYLWKVGTATITVDNTASVPTLHYAAPVWAFGGGAIGFEPQKHPGLTAAFILYGVLAAVILVCCCGSVLLSAINS